MSMPDFYPKASKIFMIPIVLTKCPIMQMKIMPTNSYHDQSL